MNRSYRILPVYAGDVSGVCSALYELGGMVVIHDPSGCNSTFNTHDETRWYDRDSLIFISGLTERDAILGSDVKLIHDVSEAAKALHPEFIALCSSPIPYISGTDLPAIAKLLERETGIPCFHVPANGMHDYTVGAGRALRCVAERFVRPAPRRKKTLNILGMTPLDFGLRASPENMRAFAEKAGFSVISCWAMGDTLDDLGRASAAEVNLVVSALGLPAAEYLQKNYGTPYVVGCPIGPFSAVLADALQTAAANGICLVPCRDSRSLPADVSETVIGDPVIMGSLAAAAEGISERAYRLLCPLECSEALLTSADRVTEGEEDLEALLAGSRHVIADPMYAPILPAGVRLSGLSHQAFSGRNGWKSAVDLTILDAESLI